MDVIHSYKIANVFIVVFVELYVVEITLGETCPVDWKLIDDVCFQYSHEEKATWSEAEELCTKKYNSSLIVINSQRVYDTIEEHEKYTGTKYWIGAKREAFSNGFIWIDGTNLWVQDKARKSPEKCVELKKSRTNVFGLNDNRCYMNLGYICGSPDVTGCNEDWNKIGNNCIKMFKNHRVSWYEAEDLCQKLGSNLAIIEKASWRTIFSLHTFDNGLWIGAQLDEDGIFKWIDGSNILDSLWLPGEPNGFEYCLHFMINPETQIIARNDEFCKRNHSFICGFKECRKICNCKRQTCFNTNTTVCSECEDNFHLTSDHLQCQLIQNTGGERNSYSESPMFIYGWACAAIILIGLITTCVDLCIRGRESLKSIAEKENVCDFCKDSTLELYSTFKCSVSLKVFCVHLHVECRNISNCKRQTCFDTNTTVCSECEDNFQLTSDHLQCQLIQNTGGERNSYSESPMFIYGWACAAFLLIVFIITCAGFCLRGRQSLKSNAEEENARRPPQSSRTQLSENTIGNNYVMSELTGRLPQQCDDCYDLPDTYIELQNQNLKEHMYNV